MLKPKLLSRKFRTPSLLVRLDDPPYNFTPALRNLPDLPPILTVPSLIDLRAQPCELLQHISPQLGALLADPAGEDDPVNLLQRGDRQELEEVLRDIREQTVHIDCISERSGLMTLGGGIERSGKDRPEIGRPCQGLQSRFPARQVPKRGATYLLRVASALDTFIPSIPASPAGSVIA